MTYIFYLWWHGFLHLYHRCYFTPDLFVRSIQVISQTHVFHWKCYICDIIKARTDGCGAWEIPPCIYSFAPICSQFCVGLRVEEPQTAFPVSFTWASYIATCKLMWCQTIPSQSIPILELLDVIQKVCSDCSTQLLTALLTVCLLKSTAPHLPFPDHDCWPTTREHVVIQVVQAASWQFMSSMVSCHGFHVGGFQL